MIEDFLTNKQDRIFFSARGGDPGKKILGRERKKKKENRK
jgi:hypothetical protein